MSLSLLKTKDFLRFCIRSFNIFAIDHRKKNFFMITSIIYYELFSSYSFSHSFVCVTCVTVEKYSHKYIVTILTILTKQLLQFLLLL